MSLYFTYHLLLRIKIQGRRKELVYYRTEKHNMSFLIELFWLAGELLTNCDLSAIKSHRLTG